MIKSLIYLYDWHDDITDILVTKPMALFINACAFLSCYKVSSNSSALLVS